MKKLKTMMDKLGLQYKIDGNILMLNGHGEIMKTFNDLDIGDYKGIIRRNYKC